MFKTPLTAVIKKNSYELPDIFKYINSLGVDEEHMYNTYNMGIGFVLCVENEIADKVVNALKELGEAAYKIGHVTSGGEGVCLE
jgi:phosphoribosylformylglycinamidine cyclo-ligase